MKQWHKDILYLFHASIIWLGGIFQIVYVFQHKSAQDITLFWVACLLIAELIALPRACDSKYKVWKLCHVIGAVLIGILLVGVWLYG